MARDSTPDAFDYSGPLSRKAVQLLRELGGLRIFDASSQAGSGALQPPNLQASPIGGMSQGPAPQVNSGQQQSADGIVEPTLDSSTASAALKIGQVISERPVGRRTNRLLSRFNRDTYLADTRSAYTPRLIVSAMLLLAVVVASGFVSVQVIFPRMEKLQAEVASIASAPTQVEALRRELELKSKQQREAQSRLTSLQGELLSPEAALARIAQFLSSLRDGGVQLVSQKNTITQSEANTLFEAAQATRKAAQTVVTVAQKSTGPSSKPSPNPAGAQAGSIPSPSLSASIAPGLNYNHYELSLTGSYSGYITARQTLVTMIPNLAIQYEEIDAMDQNPLQLSIRLYFSLPFFSK